jgi:hypothetical protein
MNLKLKAALFTLGMIFTMFVGAMIAHFTVDMFGITAVVYGACIALFLYIVYIFYSIKLNELESLEKLNGNR